MQKLQSQDDAEQGHQTLWSFTVIYTRSGKSESKLFDLDESLLLLSYTSKTFIWTSLMKSTACSIQMASFKHKISDSHNKCETAWKFILFYLRLLRSRSSVSKSRSGCGVSLGPCDCSTEELDEMTVVWPEGWMVLNWNWGPIQRRRWGPVWVTISTCGNRGNGSHQIDAVARPLNSQCCGSEWGNTFLTASTWSAQRNWKSAFPKYSCQSKGCTF